jgi:hypothetical protein
MTDDIIPFDAHRSDDDAVGVLGAMYAPPGDPAYWDGLHARIMGYVLASENGWWTAFGNWKRLGLAAAAVAIIAVGLGTRDTREAETRAAYEAVLDDTTPASAYERVTRTPGLSESDAMFLYVISYR